MMKNLFKFVLVFLMISSIAFLYFQLTQDDFVKFYKKIDLLNKEESQKVLESGWSNASIAEIENAPAAIREKSATLKVYLPSIDTYFVKLYVFFGKKKQKISVYFNNSLIKEYTATSINKVEKFYCKLPHRVVNVGFNKLKIVKESKSPPIICTQVKIKNYYSQVKTPKIFILANGSKVLSPKFLPPIKIFMAGIIVLLFLASYFLYAFACKKILKTSFEKCWKQDVFLLSICFIPFVVMYLISIFTPYKIVISSRFFFVLCFLSIVIMQRRLIYHLILEYKLEDLVSFFNKILNRSLLKIDKIYEIVIRKYLRLVQIISYKIPIVGNYYDRMQRKGVSLKKRQLSILIIIFFLVLVNLVLFHDLPTAYFSGEDATFVIDARIANTPRNLSYLLYPKYGEYSRPFREGVTFALYKLFGANPAAYYSYYLLAHIINTLLVFYCCYLFSRKKVIAFIAGLLFSVIFCNQESVMWISAASMYQPLLLFYLLGFICFIKYKLYNSFKFIILSCLCYFLGLLSNQGTITLPIVLFLYDIMFYKDKIFANNKLSNKLIYFLKTYLLYGLVAYIFLFFIQRLITVVRPRNLLHLTDFLWANVKAIPYFIIPYPRMIDLSNFFTHKLHLRILSINSYLLPIISSVFLLLVVWMLVAIWRKKPEKSFGPKYILFPLLCLFISYLPFTMTVLAGTHPVEGFISTHRRFYTLPSVFFCILFAIFIFNAYNLVDIKNKVSGWKRYIPRAQKALIVIIVFLVIFYNFKSVLPLSGEMAKSTNDARRMLEKIKTTYPEFPPESVLCITDTEGQSPYTDIRYITENLFLFYANPHNPNYIEELKEYSLEVALTTLNFNKDRRLYLYYTNLADIIVGTHTHLGGQRMFDNYFPISLPADKRIIIGLQKGLYDLDKTYFFEYNKKYDDFIIDRTQAMRKSLRPYLETVKNLKPLVENFKEEPITWISPVFYEIEGGVMKINSRERSINLKSEDKAKNLFIEIIPVIYSQEVSIPLKLAYKVEVKMKASPKSQEAISFPHVQLQVSKKDGLIPINKKRGLVAIMFEEDLANSVYQGELREMLLPRRISVLSTFYNKLTPFLTQGVFDCKAKNLIDGLHGNEHSWKGGAASGWWKIDLRALTEVSGLIWSRDRNATSKSNNGAPRDYTIQTSLDDKDWVVVKEVKDYNPEYRGETKIDTFEPITARYVKMVISATIDKQPVVIDEISVINESFSFIDALRDLYRINQLEDKLQLITDFNRFSHMQAYASSVYPGNAGFKIEHLVDGKYGHEHTWVAPPGAGYLKNWIKIDLQTPVEINKIVWSGDRKGYAQNVIKNYTIQTSLDDKDWVVVKEVKDYNPEYRGETKIDTFEPITARYVKMVINSTYENCPPEIDEFEIIGNNFQYQTHEELIQKYKERFYFISNIEELKTLTETQMEAQLSWITSTNESWDDENQTKSFDIISDGKFHKYQINISPSGEIEDIIKQFILEINCPPAEIEVEYIKIIPLKGEI